MNIAEKVEFFVGGICVGIAIGISLPAQAHADDTPPPQPALLQPGQPGYLTPEQKCALIAMQTWTPCNNYIAVPPGTPGSMSAINSVPAHTVDYKTYPPYCAPGDMGYDGCWTPGCPIPTYAQQSTDCTLAQYAPPIQAVPDFKYHGTVGAR